MHGMRQYSTIYSTAIIVSLLLSCWAVARSAVINPDGICYLQSAASMGMGFEFATHLCDQARWPFYSTLIYSISKIIHFPIMYSAYLINALLTAVSAVTFVAIVQQLKGSARVLWFSAFVFLLAHQLNLLRSDVIRDHGFWAFYLLSIFFLLRFFQNFQWRDAVLWSVSLIAATLFRIEGAIFLVFLPLSALFSQQRILGFLKLNTVVLGIFSVFILWLLFHPNISADQLGRIGEIKFQFFHGLSAIHEKFRLNADAIGQQVLNRYSANEAMLVFFLVLIAWYSINVILTFSLIYSYLLLYAWSKKSLVLNGSDRLVLWSYLLVAVLITGGFLTEHMFLSKRYLMAVLLILMFWIPFALETLYQTNKKFFATAIVFILLTALGGIFDFGYSKQYIRDASYWIEKNVPASALLYSNDYHVMYYSAHFGADIFKQAEIFKNQWTHPELIQNQYDYIALRFNKKNSDAELAKIQQWGKPVQVFANKRGDEVVIYKSIH